MQAGCSRTARKREKGRGHYRGEARRLGLVPMGENGTYYQTLNMVDRAFDESTRLSPARFVHAVDLLHPRDQDRERAASTALGDLRRNLG